jgi:predicted esterase
VAVTAAVAAASGQLDIAHLGQEFGRAYQESDWRNAISIGLELERRAPGDPAHQYNLGCVYALAGLTDEAVYWLAQAAGSGFPRLALLTSDPDLDGVRDHAGYAEVVRAVERNQRLLRAAIRQRFEATPPLEYLPPGYDPSRPAPLVIALHGFGGRADTFAPVWRRPAKRQGAVLVVPQGVRQVGTGFSWNNIDETGTILEYTLDWVGERRAIDRDRVVLTGFSQGGYLAMALGVRHPELFVGVVPIAGGYISGTDAPPPAGEAAPRYYFMVGSEDDSVEPLRRAVTDFTDAGYQVGLRVWPGVGHQFPRAVDRELGRALEFVLSE